MLAICWADSDLCGKCLYFSNFCILVSWVLALQFCKTQNWTKHRYTSGIFRVLANLTKIRANSPTFFRENKNPAKSLCFPCKFIRISRTRSPTRRRTPSRRQTHPPQGREALKCFRKVQGKLSPIFWFKFRIHGLGPGNPRENAMKPQVSQGLWFKGRHVCA